MKLLKKLFTLSAWSLGLNDPKIAGEKSLGKFSYLRHLKSFNLTWTIIDIGAHSGSFTQRVGKKLNINRIILVEPNFQHRNSLMKLIKMYPKSALILKAISIDNKVQYYFRNPNNSGQNFTSTKTKSHEKVESINLNLIFKKIVKSTDQYIFLKIDIEGNELQVLRTLNLNYFEQIKVISIEIQQAKSTLNIIEKLNEFLPTSFNVFRETRYGWIRISRLEPNWSDQLNWFQNLILVNTNNSKI